MICKTTTSLDGRDCVVKVYARCALAPLVLIQGRAVQPIKICIYICNFRSIQIYDSFKIFHPSILGVCVRRELYSFS